MLIESNTHSDKKYDKTIQLFGLLSEYKLFTFEALFLTKFLENEEK